jgi:uncharacterized membrane protein
MTRKLFLFQLFLLAASFAATTILYPHLPDRVATHWDISGQPDGYSPKSALFLAGPGLFAAIMLLTALLPWLSPQRFAIESFASTYRQIMGIISVMIAYFDAVILWFATGHPIDAGRAILGGVCLFMAVIGNLMGKVRRNFYVGIRTPWTLASERVWNATHRLGAKWLVATGLVGLALSVAGLHILPVIVLVAGALVPVVYSLVYYKQLERRGELDDVPLNRLGDR